MLCKQSSAFGKLAMKKHLWLDSLTRSRHQLTMTFGLDDLRFQATYWYGDVDLPALERVYGPLLNPA